MKLGKTAAVALSALFLLPALSVLGGCAGEDVITLRVYNWEEYIDDGGEGSYVYDRLSEEGKDPSEDDAPSIIDDFEEWYAKTYPGRRKVKVVYSTFGTNEDMYNELKLGNEYDLLCPSDYMIMKLAAEGYLEKYDEAFFDKADPLNYYIRNVSPYIQEKFNTNAGLALYNDENGDPILWKDYAAGYMWGTTGFVYNPEAKDAQGKPIDVESLLGQLDWKAFTDSTFRNKITAKDNVRDTYFAALGVTFEEELLSLRRRFLEGELSQTEYTKAITEIFNATDENTIAAVKPILIDGIKPNLFSFETDTGKSDMVLGKIWLNYAWSGDAVYALNEDEKGEEDEETGEIEEGTRLYLDYYVPEAGSNLWFDGWIMTKHVAEDLTGETKQAAQAFVNYMSMPESAMRNSYYIGYTSVIAGENGEMLDYADWLYGYEFDPETEDEPAETVEYDLTYFFLGEDAEEGQTTITAERENAEKRQLFAQFPTKEVISRCAVMDYYREDASKRINELWSHVKAETLDEWAIIVICVTVVAIALFVIFVKLGGKIDFFPPRPKKGYRKIG